jgi:acyl-coenzyme A synthetase/AMP-(fatty) acid ligase
MDEDGFLYFVGRSDDIIKTRGEKVSPIEVEFLDALPTTATGKVRRKSLRDPAEV